MSCGQTVLHINIRFRARHTPFIRAPGAKKTHQKIQQSPLPQFEEWNGEWYGKMQKNVLIFEYLGRYDRY
jgi:hypothetical protein